MPAEIEIKIASYLSPSSVLKFSEVDRKSNVLLKDNYIWEQITATHFSHVHETKKKRIVSEDFLFGLKSETLKIPIKIVAPADVSLEVLETIPEE